MYQIKRAPPVSDAHLDAMNDPLLRQIFARRGVSASTSQLKLQDLLPPQALRGVEQAAKLIVNAIQCQQKIMIMGDYDADGATSTAIMCRALHQMGAREIDYLIPNRFEFGYGLSPALVDVAHAAKAQLLVTVDNGISSHEGVQHAKSLGMQVVITDHHLPGDSLPDADAIVNPNQPNCMFASKALAGCGVAFYVISVIRQHLIKSGAFHGGAIPNLSYLLDLVSLGTVADVVPLDHNNRILVEAGLHRIRQGASCVGIQALMQVAKRDAAHVQASDLGFALAPRLNAAGRLDDMKLGVALLLENDHARALAMAHQLDALNKERRAIEQTMQQEAEAQLPSLWQHLQHKPLGIVVYKAQWHQGVIGILASRIKDKLHRPSIAFAAADDGLLKGSARSIAGVHLRDVLARIDTPPGLLVSFGDMRWQQD